MNNFFDNVPKGYTFDDVLLTPSFSEIKSRSNVDVSSQLFDGYNCKVPIIPANMSTVAGSELVGKAMSLGCPAALHRFMSPEQILKNYIDVFNDGYGYPCGISIGVNKEWYKKLFKVLNGVRIPFVIVDVAHGHHSLVKETLEDLKTGEYGKFGIIVGNVCTSEGALNLLQWGADAVKVGVGPGSICTTRRVTGCGYAQLSAIKNVSEAVNFFNVTHSRNCKVVADGGIKTSGDITKSLAAGADVVMIGGLFSGVDESPGEVIHHGDKMVKRYMGMASSEAQSVFFEKSPDDITPEGEAVYSPYIGNFEKVLKKLIGGIRSGLSYCGCKNLKELQKYGSDPNSWSVITPNGFVEGTAHALNRE